jgi:hypothetical protein
MTLDQAIERLETIRQLFGGDLELTIERAPEQPDAPFSVVMRDNMTFVRDHRINTLAAIPHQEASEQ